MAAFAMDVNILPQKISAVRFSACAISYFMDGFLWTTWFSVCFCPSLLLVFRRHAYVLQSRVRGNRRVAPAGSGPKALCLYRKPSSTSRFRSAVGIYLQSSSPSAVVLSLASGRRHLFWMRAKNGVAPYDGVRLLKTEALGSSRMRSVSTLL